MSIPVTILGGFLGAGKTTALNALLRQAETRIAVLVNDFGAVNIDAALIAARQGGMVSLSNGCVCCALGPDLGEGIARLVALDPPPQQILVEASGVGDPWRIAQLARLEVGVHLDAVLTLADAQRFPALLADRWLSDTLERQVARADLVLLSHADLATEAEIRATRAALAGLRPGLPVALLPPEGLPPLLGAARVQPGRERAGRFHADAPPAHGFRHLLWTAPGPLDHDRLMRALEALPESVLRLKGFCRLGPKAAPHLVQRAGRRVELRPWPEPLPAGADALVLIGTPEMPDAVLGTLRAALHAHPESHPRGGPT